MDNEGWKPLVGQIIVVDAEGTGKEAKFTFKGVPKPEELPDAPPADLAEAAGTARSEVSDRRPEGRSA